MSGGTEHNNDVSHTDADLLALLPERRQYVIACLFTRYSKLVYATAFRVLQDSSAAEDVVQELFFSIWRKPPTNVSASAGLAGWFVVVARNTAISSLRKLGLTFPIDDLRMASDHDFSQETEKSVMFDRICDMMKVLPIEQQRALKLAFIGGLSHSEIATATGDALSTIKSQIRAGLLTLERLLAQRSKHYPVVDRRPHLSDAS